MRNFIAEVIRDPKKTHKGRVVLHKIVSNQPVKVGVYEFTFEDNRQATYNAAVELRALPQKVLERYLTCFDMEQAGIAKFHELDSE